MVHFLINKYDKLIGAKRSETRKVSLWRRWRSELQGWFQSRRNCLTAAVAFGAVDGTDGLQTDEDIGSCRTTSASPFHSRAADITRRLSRHSHVADSYARASADVGRLGRWSHVNNVADGHFHGDPVSHVCSVGGADYGEEADKKTRRHQAHESTSLSVPVETRSLARRLLCGLRRCRLTTSTKKHLTSFAQLPQQHHQSPATAQHDKYTSTIIVYRVPAKTRSPGDPVPCLAGGCIAMIGVVWLRTRRNAIWTWCPVIPYNTVTRTYSVA